MAFSTYNYPRLLRQVHEWNVGSIQVKNECGPTLLIGSEHAGKPHGCYHTQQQWSYTALKQKVALHYLCRGRGDLRWSARLFVVEAITDATRKGPFAEAENGKWGRFIGGIQLFCLQPSGDMDRCRFRKCRMRWLRASDVVVSLFLLLKTNMLSESCDCGGPSNAIFYYSATHARTHASTRTYAHRISAAINSWKRQTAETICI